MKIDRMSRSVVRELSQEAHEALALVGAELGLSVEYKSGNFDETSAVLKFEFAVVGENGEAMTREAKDWQTLAPMYGLPEDAVGQQFVSANGRFRIVGWKAGNTKYPVIAIRASLISSSPIHSGFANFPIWLNVRV